MKIQQQLKGSTVGGKKKILKALQPLILLLSLVWGLLPGMFSNAASLPPALGIYLVFISYTELPSCCCNLLMAAGFLAKVASKMDLMVCVYAHRTFSGEEILIILCYRQDIFSKCFSHLLDA